MQPCVTSGQTQRLLERGLYRGEESPGSIIGKLKQIHQNPFTQTHYGMVAGLEKFEVKLLVPGELLAISMSLVLKIYQSRAAVNQLSQIQPGPRENETPIVLSMLSVPSPWSAPR